MNKPVCGLILLAALSAHAFAAPFLRFGDNAEIFLTGDIAARFDDNVLLTQANELDDTVLEFAPGAEFVFGRDALFSGSLMFSERIIRYVDADYLDKELDDAAFKAGYNNDKTKFTADAAYKQLNQNTRDVRGPLPVRRDVFNTSVGGETGITQKILIGAGFDYDRVDYKLAGYVDSKEFSVPLNVYYGVAPKLDVSAGFRYRDTDLATGGADSKDYFYNVGARGEFTPKITGQLNVGFNERRIQGGRDESSLGLESRFTYQPSQKTTLRLTVGNDFATSAEGDSQEDFLVALAAATNLTADWQVSGAIAYRKVDYFSGRTDDFVDFQAGVAYILNEYVKLTAGYEFRDNDSDLAGATFTNNVFSLGAKIRY